MKYLLLLLAGCMAMVGIKVEAFSGFSLNQRLGLLKNSEHANKFLEDILNDDSIEVPGELDWRKVPGRVSQVKDQGDFKTSWAFATVGVLEGQEFRQTNGSDLGGKDLVELSAQNLIDCLNASAALDGHSIQNALNLVKSENGISDERSYPYNGKIGKCQFNTSKATIKISGYAVLPHGDEEKLKQVVAKFGPVAASMDNSGRWFELYDGGVYYLRDCRANVLDLHQGVLIVGYGTDRLTRSDYWILKNSAGAGWGEAGYMRLARNRYNHCGIASAATIPFL